MPRKVEISHRTIIFTALFLILLWVLFQIRQIILLVYVSLILMMVLNPLVSRLEKFKIPRVWGVLFYYSLFLGLFSLILVSLLPSLVEQMRGFLERLPSFLGTFDFAQINQGAVGNQLGSLPEKLLRLATGLFSHFVAIFTLMVITFYLLMERKKLNRYFLILFGDKTGGRIEKIVSQIEFQLGGWVRGQLILCAVIGIMTYIGLTFLGLYFALPLSLLAGILEIVPNIGPVLSTVPAVLIALTVSPISALAVVALYFLIQQFENYLIVPLVMRKAVRLSPLIIILSLMVGFKIGGILGTLLAIPTILVFRVIILEVISSERFKSI